MPDASLLTSIRNSSAIVAAGLSSGGLPKHNISGSVTSSLKQVGRSAPPSNVTFSSFGGPPSVSFRIDNSSFAPLSNEQLQRLSNEYFSLLGLNPSSVKLTLTEGSIVVNFVYSSGTNVNTLSPNEIGIINNLANSFADGATTLQEFRTAINRANLNAYFSITTATVSAVTINVSPSLNNIINERAPGVDPTMVVFSRLGNMYTVAEGTLLETDVTSGISRKIIGNIPAPTYQAQYSFRTFYFLGISSDDKYLTFSDSIFFLNTISEGGVTNPPFVPVAQTTIHRVNLFTKEYGSVDMFSSPMRLEENIFYNPYNDTIYDAESKTIGVLDSYRFTGLNTFVKEDSALKFYKEVPLAKQIYLNQNTMLFYENNVIKRVNLASGVVTTLMSTPHVVNPSNPDLVTYNYNPANGPIKFGRLADFSPIRHYSEFYDTLQVLDVYTGVLILITGLLTSTPSIESIYGTPQPKDAQGYIRAEKYLAPNAKNVGKLSEGLNWTIPSQHYIDRYKDNSFVVNAGSASYPVITKASDYWKLFSLYILDGVYSREFKLFNVTPKPDDLVFELSSNSLFYICTGHVLGKNATGSILIPDTYRDKPVRQVGAGPLKGFQDYLGITELYIPDSVTVIGDNAFTGCVNLKGKFQLPTNLEEIGLEAFKGCLNLESSLYIAPSLKRLGVSAFNGCVKFTGNITIPGGLTFCGSGAFFGCIGLEGITFNTGITNIPASFAQGCIGLKTLTLPTTLTSVGAAAFFGCTGITTQFTLPSTLSTIGEEAFRGSKITTGSFTIPATLTSIGSYAFADCTELRGPLTIPATLTNIGNYAFTGCTGFTGTLTISEGVTTIKQGVFGRCESFDSIKLPSTITSINAESFANSFRLAGTLYIPLTVNLATDAFLGDPLIIIIRGNPPPPPPPPTVADRLILQLNDNSWYKAVGVKTLDFVGPLVIPTLASDGIPIKVVGKNLHGGTGRVQENVTSITIEEGIIEVESEAFTYCSKVQSISLPASLVKIGAGAFDLGHNQRINSMPRTITFAPNSQLAFMSHSVFMNNTIVNEFVMPDGPFFQFDTRVFENCTFLQGIRFTNNFKSSKKAVLFDIDDDSNGGGQTLHYHQHIVPAKVVRFNRHDDNLITNKLLEESISIPVENANNGYEDNILQNGIFGMTTISGNITLPSINVIGTSAFEFCTFNNTTFTFGNLKRIEANAFAGIRGSVTLNLPNSLEYIGEGAFSIDKAGPPINPFFRPGEPGYLTPPPIRTFRNPELIFTIPPNVRTIARDAFYAVDLKNIILPPGFTVIGDFTFRETIIHDDFVIPNSVIQISNDAFENATFKKKVIISSNTRALLDRGFPRTTVLGTRSDPECVLPSSLQYLGHLDAIHDTGSIILRGSVPGITKSRLMPNYSTTWINTSSTSQITRSPPAVLETDGRLLYTLLPSNTYMVVDVKVDDTNYNLLAPALAGISNLVIPATFNGKSVTHIKDYAFYDCRNYTTNPSFYSQFTSITLSNNLTHIGTSAFEELTFLTGTVTIPDSVTTLGDRVFYKTKNAGYPDAIKLPLAFVVGSGITSMGQEVFPPNTTSIQFRNGCRVIGARALYNCPNASSATNPIIIPPSVTTIGNYAFVEQTVEIVSKLSNLTHVGRGAFTDANIINFNINDSIVNLITNKFYRCKFTGTFTFPSGLTHIGDFMFSSSIQINNYLFTTPSNRPSLIGPLNLPNTLISIGKFAFYGNNRVTGQLNLPSNLTSIGLGAFQNCTGLIGQLTIPSGLTRIEYGTFDNCTGLSGTLTIPSTVTYIGPFAFQNCSNITSLIIQGTPRIQPRAFRGCTKMAGSYTRGTNYVDVLAFQGCPLFTIV
jgi:hypothetical protein